MEENRHNERDRHQPKETHPSHKFQFALFTAQSSSYTSYYICLPISKMHILPSSNISPPHPCTPQLALKSIPYCLPTASTLTITPRTPGLFQ